MAGTFKCPDCGASLKDDSRFCNYCGAKIDDGVKRMEININKKIEDAAEIKRASYEEKESLLRQKKMKRDMRKGRIKTFFFLGCVAITVIMFIVDVVVHGEPTDLSLLGAFITILPCMIWLLIKIIQI